MYYYGVTTVSRVFPFPGKFQVTFLFKTKRDYYQCGYHTGMDMVGSDSKTICSVTDGYVKSVNQHGSSYGNHVVIHGDDGYEILYAHMKTLYVKKGDRVKAKTPIGVEGHTGMKNSKANHLHMEVYAGTWKYAGPGLINPATYLGIGANVLYKTFDGAYTPDKYASTLPVGETNDGNYVQESSSSITTTTSGGYLDSLMPSGEYYKVVDLKGKYGDWLYLRRYKVYITTADGMAVDASELRCKFEIPKTAKLETNEVTIQIYNLDADTENRLIKEGNRVVVEAGYVGNQYGKIFDGEIILPIRKKDGNMDYVLELICLDTSRFIAYGFVGTTLVAGQSARDALDDIAKKSTVQAPVNGNPQLQTVYPRGKVMFGMSKDYLSQIAAGENMSYYNENGEICLMSPKALEDDEIISLSPESGLIGFPEQLELGIKFKCLINPQIRIGKLVHIDNQIISGYKYSVGDPVRSLDYNGIYRIISCKYVGDTRGNDWYQEIEAVTQAGTLPSLMAGDAVYMW
jgi:hypothetical protein